MDCHLKTRKVLGVRIWVQVLSMGNLRTLIFLVINFHDHWFLWTFIFANHSFDHFVRIYYCKLIYFVNRHILRNFKTCSMLSSFIANFQGFKKVPDSLVVIANIYLRKLQIWGYFANIFFASQCWFTNIIFAKINDSRN